MFNIIWKYKVYCRRNEKPSTGYFPSALAKPDKEKDKERQEKEEEESGVIVPPRL
jgi:hypothetical protein